MSAILKPTISNIINLWFAADTPIRQNKIRLNPELWRICQAVSRDFRPPSKRQQVEQYRKSDKVAFATAVQQLIERSKSPLSRRARSLDLA